MTFTAYDPRTGIEFGPTFADATDVEVGAAVNAAVGAARPLAQISAAKLGAALEAIASGLEDLGDELVEIADAETALGSERLRNERVRTCNQLHACAQVAVRGDHLDAVIDHADPQLVPARPDLRRMAVPIGPIAVFAASNFPLAFSVAGGDTAAALAAGCPAVVKGHPSHPQTTRLCARVVHTAIDRAGLPAGSFSLLQSTSTRVGERLVTAEGIAAVAFTGSHAGGRALFELAARRPTPIPVFAEMGSLNPVFVTPGAIAARGAEIAQAFVDSLLLGSGQFCTKPGLLYVPAQSEGFVDEIAALLATRRPGQLLNGRLAARLEEQVRSTSALPGVVVRAESAATEDNGFATTARVFVTDLDTYRRFPELTAEHFGPVAIAITYASPDQLRQAAAETSGALAASVYAEEEEAALASALLATLQERAGRVVWNGFATGVAVTEAMVHGGPYPATTNAAHTSVGASSIRRFLRPVCFQSVPDALLPDALKDDNPLGISRVVDGRYEVSPTQGAAR